MSAIQEQMEFRMRISIKHSLIRYSIVLLVSSTQHLMLMIPGSELCKSTNGFLNRRMCLHKELRMFKFRCLMQRNVANWFI